MVPVGDAVHLDQHQVMWAERSRLGKAGHAVEMRKGEASWVSPRSLVYSAGWVAGTSHQDEVRATVWV